MRIEVFFTPAEVGPQQVQGRVVAILDVLRASSSIAAALHHGARNVVPLASADDVITRAKAYDRKEVVLGGERRMHAIEGFDVGNSPAEYTAAAVEGKSVLLSTTNGTHAILATQGARDVIVASYVNFSPALAMMRTALRGGADVALVCAGRERQFALEDAACAGRLVRHLVRGDESVETNDAARAAVLIEKRYGDRIDRVFADSEHGRALAEAGFESDLELCASIDAFPVLPVYHDRQITKIGPERER